MQNYPQIKHVNLNCLFKGYTQMEAGTIVPIAPCTYCKKKETSKEHDNLHPVGLAANGTFIFKQLSCAQHGGKTILKSLTVLMEKCIPISSFLYNQLQKNTINSSHLLTVILKSVLNLNRQARKCARLESSQHI